MNWVLNFLWNILGTIGFAICLAIGFSLGKWIVAKIAPKVAAC